MRIFHGKSLAHDLLPLGRCFVWLGRLCWISGKMHNFTLWAWLSIQSRRWFLSDLIALVLLDLNGNELFKFSIHNINGFASTIHNCLEQGPCLNDRDLSLLLFLRWQVLQSCIKVVLYLCINLWHNIFLFFSDKINEFMTLLSLKSSFLNHFFHF